MKKFTAFSVLAAFLLFSACSLFETDQKFEDFSTPIGGDPLKIIVMGDSLTEGYGLTDSAEAFPSQLGALLQSEGFDAETVNAGVSGETAAGGARRVDWIMQSDPDLVIVALGGNDLLRGIDPRETEQNLRTIITGFRAEDIPVILCGMKSMSSAGLSYSREFDALYPKLSNEFNIPLVPFLLEGVALSPELNQSDGIHPNAAGARKMAETVLPYVRNQLKERE